MMKYIQRIYIELLINTCYTEVQMSNQIGKRICLSDEAKNSFFKLGKAIKLFMSSIKHTFSSKDLTQLLPDISEATIQRLFFTEHKRYFFIGTINYVLTQIRHFANTYLYDFSNVSKTEIETTLAQFNEHH